MIAFTPLVQDFSTWAEPSLIWFSTPLQLVAANCHWWSESFAWRHCYNLAANDIIRYNRSLIFWVYFKASLYVRSLSHKYQFSFMFILANYNNKNVTLRLALRESWRGIQKWSISFYYQRCVAWTSSNHQYFWKINKTKYIINFSC